MPEFELGAEQLRLLFDRAPDAVLIIDRDEIIRLFNGAAEQLYGRTSADAVGQHVGILVMTPEQQQVQSEFIAELWENRPIERRPGTRQRPDGSMVHVLLSGVPISDDDDQVVGAWLLARDVTAEVTARKEASKQFDRLVASQAAGHVGTWELDMSVMVTEWSAENSRLHGRLPEPCKLPIDEFIAMIHEDDRERGVWSPVMGRQEFTSEYRVTWPNGETHVLFNRGRWLPGEGEHPGFLIGTTVDMTTERAALVAEQRANEHFRRVFEDGIAAMIICDRDFRILQVNNAFCELVGRDRSELVGVNARSLSSSILTPEEEAVVAEQLRRGESTAEERLLTTGDQQNRWVEAVLSPVIVEGDIEEFLIQVRDVTARRAEAEQLRTYADRDPLTGVLNRRAFDRQLREYLSSVAGDAVPGTLLMLDLDNFKRHNDTYGHGSGDALLVGITDTIGRSLREQDLLGRLGGDEFVVLLAGVSASEADLVAGRLLNEIRAYAAATVPDDDQPVTASIGLVELGHGMTDAGGSLIEADRALYDAKAQGRDRWVRSQSAIPGPREGETSHSE